MVDILPVHDYSDPLKRFVSSGKQLFLLTECQELEHGDILATASSPRLRIPFKTLTSHDVAPEIATVAEFPKTSTPPYPDAVVAATPTAATTLRMILRPNVSIGFVMTNANLFIAYRIPFAHTFASDFALGAADWNSSVIDAVCVTLTDYTDVFSSVKLNYDECSLSPSEIQVF